MNRARLARAPAALAAACVLVPTMTHAALPTTYVSWSPGVIAIRAAIGTETDISFGPGEQITYATVDDAVRWDAHEAEPIKANGDVIERVAVRPSQQSATNLLVRTNERTYRVRLLGVTSAPSQVAFVYSRNFISRSSGAPSAAADSVTNPTRMPDSHAGAMSPHVETNGENVALAYPNTGTGGASIPNGTPGLAPDVHLYAQKKCAPSGGGKAMQAVKYVTQGANAIAVARAVRNHAVSNAVFGLHSLLYYASTFAIEDFAVNRATKNACPRTKTLIDFGMAAAAGFNAAVTPSK